MSLTTKLQDPTKPDWDALYDILWTWTAYDRTRVVRHGAKLSSEDWEWIKSKVGTLPMTLVSTSGTSHSDSVCGSRARSRTPEQS